MFSFASNTDFTDAFRNRLKASGFDPDADGDIYSAFCRGDHAKHDAIFNACYQDLSFQLTLYGALLVEHHLQAEGDLESNRPYFDKAVDQCFSSGILSFTTPLHALPDVGCALLSDPLMVNDLKVKRDMYVQLYSEFEDYESSGFDDLSPDGPWEFGTRLARYARLVDVDSTSIDKKEYGEIPAYVRPVISTDFICSGHRNVTEVSLTVFDEFARRAKSYPTFVTPSVERLCIWSTELARLARLNNRDPSEVVEGVRALHDVFADQANLSPHWRGVFARQATINAVALWPEALGQIEPPVKPREFLPHPELRNPASLVRAEKGMDEVLQGAYRAIRPYRAYGYELDALAGAMGLSVTEQLGPLLAQSVSGDLTIANDLLKQTGGYFDGIDELIGSAAIERSGRSHLSDMMSAVDTSRLSTASLDLLNYQMVKLTDDIPYPEPANLLRHEGHQEGLIKHLLADDNLNERTAKIAGLSPEVLMIHLGELSNSAKRYVVESQFDL